MIFQDQSNKASCPYNKNHTFDKEKLLFHINRCKDRQKVGHLFTSCQYNRIHIVPKDELFTHQLTCPDRHEMKQLMAIFKNTLVDVRRERERSRERSRDKVKKEDCQRVKWEVKEEKQEEYLVLEGCPLCLAIIKKLQEIKKVVPESTLTKIRAVEKILKKNHELTKAQEQLQKHE